MDIPILDRFTPIIRKRGERIPSLPRWNLVRGGSRTYDVASQSGVGTRTNWVLNNPPTGFTISSAGEITAVLPHNYTATPGTLSITTTEGEIRVPTRIRDWFLGDLITPRHYYSVSRAWDGASGRPLLDVSIRDISNSEVEIAIINSGADGYADTSALDNALNDRYFAISRIYDQINGAHLTPVNSRFGFIGHRRNNTLSFFRTPGGMLAMRGTYTGRDTDETDSFSVGLADYNNEDASWQSPMSMCAIGRRQNTSTDPEFRFQDDNAYPGWHDTGVSSYRFNTNGRLGNDPALETENNTKWALLLGDRLHVVSSLQDVYAAIYSLEADDDTLNESEHFGTHSGGDMELLCDEYDFAEGFVLEHGADTQGTDRWLDNKLTMVNNAVAKFGGADFIY